jgi:hypothetical protein
MPGCSQLCPASPGYFAKKLAFRNRFDAEWFPFLFTRFFSCWAGERFRQALVEGFDPTPSGLQE